LTTWVFPLSVRRGKGETRSKTMAWHVAAKADEVANDEILGVVVNGEPIALYNLGGTYYATGNVCTHEYALLSDGYIEGDCIECPLHQARFHIATGAVRAAPADEPIKSYPVKVEGGQILVELPGS
jgi:3-phenylpropionate/trans-cinnamate dioxygenase ferredoxin subunit